MSLQARNTHWVIISGDGEEDTLPMEKVGLGLLLALLLCAYQLRDFGHTTQSLIIMKRAPQSLPCLPHRAMEGKMRAQTRCQARSGSALGR